MVTIIWHWKKPKIILSGGGGNQYDAYNRYFVLEADLGLNSTDQVGFILIDSNSCLGEKSFRLKTIGQSKDSFCMVTILWSRHFTYNRLREITIEKTNKRLKHFGMKHYLKTSEMAQETKRFNLDRIVANQSY